MSLFEKYESFCGETMVRLICKFAIIFGILIAYPLITNGILPQNFTSLAPVIIMGQFSSIIKAFYSVKKNGNRGKQDYENFKAVYLLSMVTMVIFTVFSVAFTNIFLAVRSGEPVDFMKMVYEVEIAVMLYFLISLSLMASSNRWSNFIYFVVIGFYAGLIVIAPEPTCGGLIGLAVLIPVAVFCCTQLVFASTRIRWGLSTEFDENGNEINKDNVFVIERFNDKFKFDKTSKLLVNQDLKEKYDDLLKEIKDSKQILIKSIQEYVKSDSKDKITLKDIESIFINDLCEFGDNFIDIILNLPKIEENLLPVEDLRYDTLFHETNIKLVSKSTIQKNIFEYCEEYNKLIEGSEIFNNEFAHNNALNIGDNLKSNGFFKAEHKLKLSNGTIINSKSDLKNLVKKEKEIILKDMENKFDDIDNQLDKSKKI